MKKRHRISNSHSRKVFSKSASGRHPKNVRSSPMRGGIRL